MCLVVSLRHRDQKDCNGGLEPSSVELARHCWQAGGLAKAYSEDLRERTRQAWEEETSTRPQIAARFGVSNGRCATQGRRAPKRAGAESLRAGWPERLAGVAARDLVFLDESGCHRAMTRTHARSLRGPARLCHGPAPLGRQP